MGNKIEWKQTGNDPDDLIAKPNKTDTLRVAALNSKECWWCVWIGDESWDCWHGKRAKTVEQAKQFCEEKYFELIKDKN
jgi:hypothetical protein